MIKYFIIEILGAQSSVEMLKVFVVRESWEPLF